MDINKEIDLYQFPKMDRIKWIVPLLERLLCIPQINNILTALPETEDMIAIVDQILDDLSIIVNFSEGDSQQLSNQNPLIVVSNHPLGGIDGLILAKVLLEKGCKVKIFTNFLLDHIKALSPIFIAVNPFTNTSNSTTISGVKTAHKWLAQNGTLVVFPSGTVSCWHWHKWQINDPLWHHSAVRFAHQYNASILPLYIHGRNHWSFYLAGLISPNLRTMLLPRQLFNQPKREIGVIANKLITPTELSKHGNYINQTRHLREIVYHNKPKKYRTNH